MRPLLFMDLSSSFQCSKEISAVDEKHFDLHADTGGQPKLAFKTKPDCNSFE